MSSPSRSTASSIEWKAVAHVSTPLDWIMRALASRLAEGVEAPECEGVSVGRTAKAGPKRPVGDTSSDTLRQKRPVCRSTSLRSDGFRGGLRSAIGLPCVGLVTLYSILCSFEPAECRRSCGRKVARRVLVEWSSEELLLGLRTCLPSRDRTTRVSSGSGVLSWRRGFLTWSPASHLRTAASELMDPCSERSSLAMGMAGRAMARFVPFVHSTS